jgi:hypothetical protein
LVWTVSMPLSSMSSPIQCRRCAERQATGVTASKAQREIPPGASCFGSCVNLRPGVVGTISAVRTLSLLLLAALIASSCRVAVEDFDVAAIAPGGSHSALVASTLPAVGPVPTSSHWHAAYVVRVCDDVLPPFESDNDPLGVHSHGDGLMHVHPFFEESGYENARMSLFADAMGFEVSDGELTLPGGGTWRDGDLCNGVPGRVFVDRWASPDSQSQAERLFQGLDEIRYQADGELYQIAFAPVDSFPVVPPATRLLFEVSNLASAPEPWVDATRGSMAWRYGRSVPLVPNLVVLQRPSAFFMAKCDVSRSTATNSLPSTQLRAHGR